MHRGLYVPIAALALMAVGRLLVPAWADVSLQLGSGSTTPQGTISLPLSISTIGTPRAAGTQWTLTYSPSDIAAISVAPGPAAIAAAKSISCAGANGSYKCLATGINTNLEGDGVLAIVTITLTHQVTRTTIGVSNALSTTLVPDALATTGTGGTVVAFVPGDTQMRGGKAKGLRR